MLALRLPDDSEKRLEILAARTGCSKSFYARGANLRHLGELEDAYLARDRLERGGPRLSLDELEQEFAAALTTKARSTAVTDGPPSHVELDAGAADDLRQFGATDRQRVLRHLRTRLATPDDPRQGPDRRSQRPVALPHR